MDLRGVAIFFGLVLLAHGFPQQGFNTDFAEDPNSVDESIGWSWGVSSNEDRNTQVNQPSRQNPTRAPQQQTTNASSGVTNVPSEAFLRCVDNCPTTSEYNPICGSDMQSYHNMAKFECAVSCGARIRPLMIGTCQPING